MFSATAAIVVLLAVQYSRAEEATYPASASAANYQPQQAAPASYSSYTATTAAPAAATYGTSYNQPAANYYDTKLTFYGYYAGVCQNDGFYVNGPYSIVACSNGRAHIQPCAPGTRNAAIRSYVTGVAYQFTDFCSENLNDYAQSGTPAVVAPYYPVVYPYAAAYYPGYPYV